MTRAWRLHAGPAAKGAALVAVGGYGRGELHPQSDIDLLVLLDSTEGDADEAIGRFLTFLWDIGLEVGHSVRTLDDCEAQARRDVTILTTLMETRLLSGPGRLFAELPVRITASLGTCAAEIDVDVDAARPQFLDQLIGAADAAMYRSKRAGGNRVQHRTLDSTSTSP